MIAIETESGELIKVLKNIGCGDFGFHEQFGFISKRRAQERCETKRIQGFEFIKNDWFCSFNLLEKGGELLVEATKACKALRLENGWLLETPNGNYKVTQYAAGVIDPLLVEQEDRAAWMDRLPEIFFIFSFVVIGLIYLLREAPSPEGVVEKKIEPLTVTIVEQPKAVNVQREVSPNIKVKPLTKAEISKRAVNRNLGFLGMVGSTNVTDAVGGVPQKLERATAGAGPGGDAGSGGEVLTNLGKGLKKTTVGNTGVAGLGGKLVTKGTSGGGKGGYGNTLVASGSGKGISAIAVSSSDMVLEGGLSRYAINATIAKYLNQVRRCYETQLKTKPTLQGLVEMSFEINKTGMLNFARVSRTSLKDKPTEQCISKKMMTWQFPKPKGNVKVPVKYPFMLRPVGQ